MKEPTERHFEALQPNLTSEEACLSAVLDLNSFQEIGLSKAVSDFYTAFTGVSKAPEDLQTRISAYSVDPNPQGPSDISARTSYVEGFEIAASVVVDFEIRSTRVGEMLNLDFVKTTEGLQVMRRGLVRKDEEVVRGYTQQLTEYELAALARDALAAKDLIIEDDAELMKLGPLVEEEAEDGSRRFHIGDILSITTSSRLISPRGVDGIRDILSYMTNDRPFTTQLGRFAEECKPYLEKQLGEAINPYSEVPESVKDRLTLCKWLLSVTDSMNGDPFLKIDKINEEDHTVLDPMTELELDYGPEIKNRFIQIDPDSFTQDKE